MKRASVMCGVPLACSLLLTTAGLRAQEDDVHIVQDLNTTTGGASSDPTGFVSVGDTVYFIAWDPAHGRKLWKTDGTPEGTVLAADLVSAADAGVTLSLTTLNGAVLFGASREDVGAELWRTDGVLNGTRLVKDIYPGATGSSPAEFTRLGDILFFSAYDGQIWNGPQLWRTDGTGRGTALVDQTHSCRPWVASPVVGRLVIDCEDGLYSTVGSPESMTSLVPLGAHASLIALGSPGVFLNLRQTLGEGSVELIVTDGTPATTRTTILASWMQPSFSAELSGGYAAFGDSVAFGAPQPACGSGVGAIPFATWMMEPRSGEPARVIGCERPLGIIAFGDEGLMVDTDRGTPALSKLVSGGSTRSVVRTFEQDDEVTLLFATDEEVLFTTTNKQQSSLWRTDGTSEGTRRVTTGILPAGGALAGRTLIFANDDGVHGNELWRTNLADETTSLLMDLVPGSYSSVPEHLTSAGRWLFYAGDDATGRSVWRTDGEKPQRVTGLDGLNEIQWLTVVDGTLYVLDTDAEDVSKLWLVDTNDNQVYGSVELGVIVDAALRQVGDRVFVVCTSVDQVYATDIWVLDPGTGAANPSTHIDARVSPLSGRRLLFFTTSNDVTNTRVWASDGTDEGTRLVREVPLSTSFWSMDGADVMTIVEGDQVGTWLLEEQSDDFVLMSDTPLCHFAGSLQQGYFAVECGATQLWRGSGQVVEPGFDLADLGGDFVSSLNDAVLFSDGSLYVSMFNADQEDPDAGAYQTLWVTDGTFENSAAVFAADDYFVGVPAPGGGVIFAAPTELGFEPWISRGTVESTHLLQDIAPGSVSSLEQFPGFTTVGEKVFFVADDGSRGVELWVYQELPSENVQEPPPPVEGCSVTALPPNRTPVAFFVAAWGIARVLRPRKRGAGWRVERLPRRCKGQRRKRTGIEPAQDT